MSSIAELLSLGTRHHQAGQLAQAERIYRQILARDPQHAQALHQLGVVASQAGDFRTAVELIERALRADPSQARFSISLGEAHRQAGALDRAMRCNQQALALDPSLAPAHANLGLFHEQLGNLAEAASHFRQFAALEPENAQAGALLARALLGLGDLAGAEQCFRAVIATTPGDARAHYNLGAVLQAQGRLAEAVASYRRAIAIQPLDAAAHNNLGTALQQTGQADEAETHYRLAIAADEGFADARSNLAATLIGRFHHDEALVQAQAAVGLKPELAAAHRNLALALQGLGRLDEAIAQHRRAMELAPGESKFASALLYLLNYHLGYDAQTVAAEHRAWGTRYADPLTARSLPHANDRSGGRKLRVGYVSPYFLNHAVNFFVEPILAAHDHATVEVFCYSEVERGDEVTARLREYSDHWRPTAGLSDERLSQAVRDDRIDILVDLTGHIGGSRLLAFARKPAPVQVTYIGYQNTTGMRAMDYRLTDAYSDPPGATEALYSETLLRLPTTFFCYLPSSDAPAVEPLPAAHEGYVTFGAFNSFTKVTPQALDTWAQLLAEVPGSRLVLLAEQSPSLQAYVLAAFERHGVESGRIEIIERLERREYLARIGRVDVALDPFPFNGHTTTCDALWQGVPVVTFSGATYAARFGGSGLATLGLDELIAHSTDEYLAIARDLAGDLDRLAALRSSLRERMAASPLLDFGTFTRNLETAYREMWIRWCESAPERTPV